MRIDLDNCRDPDLLAGEVRRLRAVIAGEQGLTDAEREAVEWVVENLRLSVGVDRAATLRGLLERIGGGVR